MLQHTCGDCRFSEEVPPTSKNNIPAPERVRCGKYDSYKTYPANEVNDCMEWEPKESST